MTTMTGNNIGPLLNTAKQRNTTNQLLRIAAAGAIAHLAETDPYTADRITNDLANDTTPIETLAEHCDQLCNRNQHPRATRQIRTVWARDVLPRWRHGNATFTREADTLWADHHSVSISNYIDGISEPFHLLCVRHPRIRTDQKRYGYQLLDMLAAHNRQWRDCYQTLLRHAKTPEETAKLTDAICTP